MYNYNLLQVLEITIIHGLSPAGSDSTYLARITGNTSGRKIQQLSLNSKLLSLSFCGVQYSFVYKTSNSGAAGKYQKALFAE